MVQAPHLHLVLKYDVYLNLFMWIREEDQISQITSRAIATVI